MRTAAVTLLAAALLASPLAFAQRAASLADRVAALEARVAQAAQVMPSMGRSTTARDSGAFMPQF